jgi:hypothetical protein
LAVYIDSLIRGALEDMHSLSQEIASVLLHHTLGVALAFGILTVLFRTGRNSSGSVCMPWSAIIFREMLRVVWADCRGGRGAADVLVKRKLHNICSFKIIKALIKGTRANLTWATFKSSASWDDGPGTGGIGPSRSSKELRDVRGDDMPEPASDSLHGTC